MRDKTGGSTYKSRASEEGEQTEGLHFVRSKCKIAAAHCQAIAPLTSKMQNRVYCASRWIVVSGIYLQVLEFRLYRQLWPRHLVICRRAIARVSVGVC